MSAASDFDHNDDGGAMTLKFEAKQDGRGYQLHISTEETTIVVDASEAELRRLLIDLVHGVGAESFD